MGEEREPPKEDGPDEGPPKPLVMYVGGLYAVLGLGLVIIVAALVTAIVFRLLA